MNRKEALEGINDKLKDLKYYAKEMGEVLKSTNYFIDELERQAKKVERKLKAYHVTDEYSYNCLMKELEEQGYDWHYNQSPSDCDYWSILKEKTVIYCNKNKYLSYSRLDYYTEYEKDNYDLIEYHKEEPLYYARFDKIENIDEGYNYWILDTERFKVLLGDSEHSEDYKTQFTKTKWNELGINETNADFEKVAE